MENKATTKTPIPTRSGFRNFALCTLIFAFSQAALYTCRDFSTNRPLFSQNKANVKIGNINISAAAIKSYANKQRTMNNKRYPKQTQSNPISNAQTAYPVCRTRDCHGLVAPRNDGWRNTGWKPVLRTTRAGLSRAESRESPCHHGQACPEPGMP
jgi:hypothetical protein